MPNIAGHMIIAKLVSDKLKIDDPDFIRGNLLPDIINISREKSHHKIQGKYFLIPDIDFFKHKLNLKNKLELGYLTHLLLDKYFLEEYIPNNIKNFKLFEDKTIYKEYDMINYKLVKKFNLDIEKIKNDLKEINFDIDKKLLEKNIEYLFNKNEGKTELLDFDEYSNFLYNTSFVIYNEIKEYVK